MGDAEDNLQPSKKRAAGRQLSRDNPGLDDEETSEQETGTFKRASDEVMASRKIVKVRRNTSAPSSNPFAGIRLVSPTDSHTTPSGVATEAESAKTVPENVEDKSASSKGIDEINKQPENDISDATSEPTTEKKDEVNELKETTLADEKNTEGDKTKEEPEKDAEANNGEAEGSKDSLADNRDIDAKNEAAPSDFDLKKNDDAETENEEKKDGDKNVGQSAGAAPFSSFKQLSSGQNAFTGIAGSGFSSSTFSFGSVSKGGSSSGSLFGPKTDQPAFSFGLSTNGTSLFATSSASIVNKSEKTGFPSMQEVPVETGEENEKAVFTADSALFEFSEGAWRERGKGEVKVNVSTVGTGKARLVMRTKGNYRLILNASLYADMKLTNMDKKGITFACINSASEGKDGLSTYALKLKDASFVEEFRAAVTEHKGKAAVSLKTPENSPKASDD